MVKNKMMIIIIIINLCNLRTFDTHHEFIIQFDNKKYVAKIIKFQDNVDKYQVYFVDSKSFKNDKKSFKSEFESLKHSFSIILMEIETVTSSYYYIDLTLESLCKSNKIFKQYETFEEAYNCVIKLFEKEKITIYNNTDNLSLGFMMNSATCENEEVIFKLKEKKMDKDEINEKVFIETNILIKTIKSLKEEINELKNKIKDYEIRLNSLELRDEKIYTKILDNKSQLQIIKIEFEEKYEKTNIQFSLNYRANRNGVQYSNLELQLKNLNNTLILFHTTKGLKFGIFLQKGLVYTKGNNYDEKNRRKLNLYNSEYSSRKY